VSGQDQDDDVSEKFESHAVASEFQGTGGKMTVTRHIAKISLAEGIARGSSGAGFTGKSAKVYPFPPPVAVYTGDLRMDEARAGEMDSHPAVIIEIAAAVLAFAFWLVWRLTRLSVSR